VVAPPGASAEGVQWLVEAFRRMRESEAWQEILRRNEWEDSFLAGPELRLFLTVERTRAEAILGELEFGTGGAGYAPVGAWTFPVIILSVLTVSTIWVARGRSDATRLDLAADSEPLGDVSWARVMLTGALFIGFAWGMDLLGYHLATVLLLVGLARVFGGQRAISELIFAIALAAVSFVVFDTLLGVRLPLGPFEGLVR
jgi:hypothetical protein